MKSKVKFSDVVEASANPDRREVLGLDIGIEFDRNFYNTHSYDLGKFGLRWTPVVSRMSNSRYATPSPWHVHDECIEIICCDHGSCEYETQEGLVRLLPGWAFVSRPDEPHRQLTNPRRFSTYCLFLRLSAKTENRFFDREMRWLVSRLRKVPRAIRVGPDLVSRLGRLFRLLDKAHVKDLERTIRLRTVIVSLLLDVIDAAARRPQPGAASPIEEVAKEMAEHPERSFSADELVSRLMMSPTALLGAFKRVTGFSPHAYLIKCRVDRAKDLLSRGTPVAKVAAALHFISRRHFTALFRRSTGMTPAEWASRAQGA